MTESPFQSHARAAWSRATRASQTWRSQPTWIQRLAMGVVVVSVLGLTAIVLVSSLVVGIVVAGIGGVALGAASVIRRIRGTDRAGRRNVRVIVREQP